MTREEIMNLDLDGIEARKAEIRELIGNAADDAALDEIDAEKAIIEERMAQITEQRKADMEKVAAGLVGEVKESMEEKRMNTTATKEYMHAFAQYIKTGDDKECRALLSLNSSVETNPGQVPVPEALEGRIKTAWQRNTLMDLVSKSYIKGNLTIGFELSSTAAVVHAEGTAAPDEEVLTIGKVQIVPQTIKKWISVSDEVLDMTDEDFVDYIYDELTYRIAKKAQEVIINLIKDSDTASSDTAAGVPTVPDNSDLLSVIDYAKAALNDEAADLTIVMNRATEATFKDAARSANFAMNPLEGLRIVYDNTLPAYGTAAANAIYAILGDFNLGLRANFPNGADIRILRDDYSLAEADLVKFVGRQFVGFGVVAENAFVKIQKGDGNA